MRNLIVTTLGFLNRRHRYQLLLLVLLVLVSAAFETFSVALILPFVSVISDPALLQKNFWLSFLHQILGEPSVNAFILMSCLGLAVLFVVRNIYLGVAVYIRQRYVYAVFRSLVNRLARCFLYRPYSHHLDRNSADFTRLIVIDAVNVASGSIDPILIIITEILVSGTLVGLMVWMKPVETLSTMGMFGLIIVISGRLMRRHLAKLGQILHNSHTDMVKWATQCANGAREAIVLDRRGYFLDLFKALSAEYSWTRVSYTTFKDLPRLVMEGVAVIAMMALVAVMILNNRGAGDVIPFLAMSGVAAFRIMPSAARIYSAMMTLHLAKPQIDAVHQDFTAAAADGIDIWLEDDKAQPVPAPLPFDRDIRLDQVSFSYAGAERAALSALDLVIPRGTSVGIVGPSGGGKTTLIGLMLGLLSPQSGAMRVDGTDIAPVLASWRRRIGYIPQDVFLLDDSIRANVAFGIATRCIDADAVNRAIAAAQLTDFIATLPDGLDTMVGERGVKLSGGQRQRIAIARALYHDPDVLLLDEATAALDNKTERELGQAINSLAGKKTLIIVAHRLTTVEKCDVLYFLKDGAVAASGTYQQLLDFPEFRSMALDDGPAQS